MPVHLYFYILPFSHRKTMENIMTLLYGSTNLVRRKINFISITNKILQPVPQIPLHPTSWDVLSHYLVSCFPNIELVVCCFPIKGAVSYPWLCPCV